MLSQVIYGTSQHCQYKIKTKLVNISKIADGHTKVFLFLLASFRGKRLTKEGLVFFFVVFKFRSGKTVEIFLTPRALTVGCSSYRMIRTYLHT